MDFAPIIRYATESNEVILFVRKLISEQSIFNLLYDTSKDQKSVYVITRRKWEVEGRKCVEKAP